MRHRDPFDPPPGLLRTRRRLLAAGVSGAAFALVTPAARAAVGGLPTNVAHDDSSPQWEALRDKLFGRRPIASGEASQVQLIVPLRAAYGASVPVKVVSKLAQTPKLYVKRMVLLVDKNPSPVAATIEFTVDAGQADIETRMRVDEYSHVRVISELSNGELHMDSRYAKVSGGCSAPSNRDREADIGRTVLRIAEGAVKMHAPVTADVSVAHPNDTGFELNERSLLYIPAYFVRSIKVSFAQRSVFDADLDFSMSENPSLRFCFVPHSQGELRATVVDSKDMQYTGTLAVA